MNYNNKNKINNIKITSITPTPPPAAAATDNNITRPNGTQACAACKYQRRKCAPDCILAPYFPHHRQRQFLNAHKLFGVSNIITKIIRSLHQHDKDQAMRTIIYQSDVRANDPVGGCYRIIRDLQRQIEFYRAELQLVLHQLDYFRAQNQFKNVNQLHSNNSGSFEMITNDNNYNKVQQYHYEGDDQIHRSSDVRGQEQYILHGDDCDLVHFEEINSWEETELEAKKSCDGAENWQEDINAKLLSDERREGLKFEAEEKSFDSVNNFRLKSTPAK